MNSASNTLTKQLLAHLIALTRHRDHQLLDVALVAALRDLTGARQARVLDLVKHRETSLLQPRIWMANGTVATLEETSTEAAPEESLLRYPALQEALRQRMDQVDEQVGNDAMSWWILWLNEIAVGCVQVCTDQPLSMQQREIANGILEVYRNQRSLLDYSERDSLTGLLNRKTFDDNFFRLLSSHAAGNIKIAADAQGADSERRLTDAVPAQWLAVVDIDFFKRVNDQFGHVYGDEVLILVANLLRSSFRSQDLIFRFGGEEFVILLRSSVLQEAKNAFERFRANVEAHHFPQLGTVTITLGFASITNETPVEILGHADQALYFGKTHGRNQICFYDELVREGLLDVPLAQDSEVFFFDDLPAPD
jgi:diguanylate cyclase (GGDEF)-like protein